MKSIIDLATQGATEMKTLSKHHIEAIEKAKTELGKINAAALAMIETRMDLIKAVLLKHEVAVLEVMCELHQQQQADEALLRQVLEDICGAKLCEVNSMSSRAEARRLLDKATNALRVRLGETGTGIFQHQTEKDT